MESYRELLDELRHRYFKKYDAKLDDELLYIIIRINELQVDLKKDIQKTSKVAFNHPKDYFYYGLGSGIKWLIILFAVGVLGFTVYLFCFNQ